MTAMIKPILSLLSIGCFLVNTLSAQELKLNKLLSLQKVEGLENVINPTEVMQDNLGYIWIGSQSGLYKFDGYKAIQYAFDPNQPNKIAGNWVGDPVEDAEGNIWFGIFGVGLQKLNPATGQFTLYKADPSSPEALESNRIQFLKILNDKLWISSQSGISAFNFKTGKFKTYLKIGYVRIIKDNETVWMVGRGKSLNYYESKSDSILTYDSLKLASNPELVFCINEKIYLDGESNGNAHLFVYDIKSKILKPLEPFRKSDWIYDMISFGNDQLLIARKNQKLEFYDTKKDSFYTLPVNSEINQEDFYVYKFYKLKNGDLWLIGDKIYKAISDEKGIETYDLVQGGKKILLDFPVLSQWEPNNMAIGLSFLIDFNKGTAIKASKKYPFLSKFDSAYTSLQQYVNVYTDENKDSWVAHFQRATFKTTLYKFSNSRKQLEKLGTFSKSLGTIFGISKLGDDIWIAGWSALAKWHIPTAKEDYYAAGKDSMRLHSAGLRHIFKDREDDLWIATQNGLHLRKKNQAYFNYYLPRKGDTNAISFNVIQTIKQDASGLIWVGTLGGGVNILDKKKDKFNWITTKQGLANNNIRNLLIDDNQDVWVSHDLGISKINNKTKTIQNFTQTDGIINTSGDANSEKMPDGSLIFSGIGFNRIFPNKIKSDTFQPPLLITNFKLFNKEVVINDADSILHRHINITKSITLKHNQNVFTLEYAALDMAHPSQVLYAYQLVGFDPDWQYVSNKREVTYTNLPSGNYIFKVKSTHNEGVWYETEHPLSITILPPWWRTWWAYLLYTLAIGLALRAYIQYRSRTLKAENIILEEKVLDRTNELEVKSIELGNSLAHLKATQNQLIQSEKLASLGELTAGIAHEIQNPLNFVNNFSELSVDLVKDLKDELKRPEKDATYINELFDDLSQNQEKINHHGKRASSIVKGMLEHSRASTGVKELTDINKLADEYLRLSYHGLRAKDNTFNADFSTDFEGNLPKIEVIPQDIGRVLLNLINNAFYAVNERAKLSEGLKPSESYIPSVSVTTQQIDNLTKESYGQIVIKVKDNGTGMPESVRAKVFQPFFTTKPTGQGTGLGLSLAYDIVIKGHGGSLEVLSTEGVGTTFIVQLPFKTNG